MANEINYYKSTDTNSPGNLTGTAGSLLTVLDAVLVNGYTAISVTSITRSGSVATVTLGSSDNSLYVGSCYTIAGAAQSEYNGRIKIASVISPTQFTYTVSGTPASPATGTITCGRSAAGWTKPFSGTNKAVYYPSSTNNLSRKYLRVLDDGSAVGGARDAIVTAYNAMTDVDTGTNSYGGLYWRKSGTADSTARAWSIIADDRSMYICTTHGAASANTYMLGFFGRITSFKSGDAYGCVLVVNSTSTTASDSTTFNGFLDAKGPSTNSMGTGAYIAGSVAQVVGGLAVSSMATVGTVSSSAPPGNGTSTNSWLAFPNSADGAIWVAPLIVSENSNSTWRGQYPGMVYPIHSAVACTLGDLATNIAGYSGRTFVCLIGQHQSAATGRFLIDITGPWA